MTLSEMITNLTSRIGVVNGQEISNNILIMWLNEALRAFCDEADFNWLMARATSSTSTGQTEYALPDDFSRPFELRVNGSTASDHGVYHYFPYEQRYGVPSGVNGYTYLGNTLILLTTPTADGSGNIELTYVRTPTDMSANTDSPSDFAIASMPAAYHAALICYAFALYNGYDEEAADSQYWLGNATNPSPGTYNWFVKKAVKRNGHLKKGERRKMLSKQEATGYTHANQVGIASPVLKI